MEFTEVSELVLMINGMREHAAAPKWCPKQIRKRDSIDNVLSPSDQDSTISL